MVTTMTAGELFGESVKRVRLAKGWRSQERLVDALDGLGYPTTRSTITRLEAGNRSPGVDEALAISAALEVSPIDLVLPTAAEQVAVTPTLTVPTREVRAWYRGVEALPGQDWTFLAQQSSDFWVDAVSLRRQARLRYLVEELAEADEDDDGARRAKLLDDLEMEVGRQRETGREEVR